MEQNTKHIGTLLFAISLAALLILAASLSSLQLKERTSFGVDGSSQDASLVDEIVVLVESQPLPLLQGIMALGFVGLLLYLGYRIYRYINLRIIVWTAVGILVLFAMMIILPHYDLGTPTIPAGELTGGSTPLPGPAAPLPLGQPPLSLIWLVFLVVISGIVWLIVRIMRGRLASAHVDDPILENAQQAVDALRAGMDLRNVVIRCYFQMALALQEKHGIQLEATMTAREFERLLEYEGFPVAPVHQLTSLFEKVRYSSQDTITQADEAMALASLNAIIQAGSQGRGGSDE